jgi:hypothetical protein
MKRDPFNMSDVYTVWHIAAELYGPHGFIVFRDVTLQGTGINSMEHSLSKQAEICSRPFLELMVNGNR